MIVLFVIVFLLLGSWRMVALFRRLWRQPVGVGCWSAIFSEYNLGPHFRVGGFPFPVVFFRWEAGNWVDYGVPEFQAWLTVLTNIITVTVLTTLPLWLVIWRWQKR